MTEVKEKYKLEISNRFAASESLHEYDEVFSGYQVGQMGEQ
jgi:hypothetical protein